MQRGFQSWTGPLLKRWAIFAGLVHVWPCFPTIRPFRHASGRSAVMYIEHYDRYPGRMCADVV